MFTDRSILSVSVFVPWENDYRTKVLHTYQLERLNRKTPVISISSIYNLTDKILTCYIVGFGGIKWSF